MEINAKTLKIMPIIPIIAQAKAKGSLCLSFSLGKIKKNPGNTIINNSMSYPATFIYS